VSFGIAVFHFEIAPLDIAEVAHPQQKLVTQVECYRIRRPRRIEIAKPYDFRLLRPRRKRHAITVPPSSVMNSRGLIQSPRRREEGATAKSEAQVP
jgi:hypothetical protein